MFCVGTHAIGIILRIYSYILLSCIHWRENFKYYFDVFVPTENNIKFVVKSFQSLRIRGEILPVFSPCTIVIIILYDYTEPHRGVAK